MIPDLIAIVDDDRLVGEAVRRLVDSMDFKSELFASIDDLFAYDALAQVGCVLSDVHFVDGDARGLIQRLASVGCHAPVVFMTAGTEPGLHKKLMDGGAVRILGKPFAPRELVDELAVVLPPYGRYRA